MDEGIIVLVTAGSREEADRIASALVHERLAACVNIIPGLQSVFFWEGRVQRAEEVLLVCKSRKPVFERLKRRVVSLHSYSVPEVIALPIVAGLAAYLDWVGQNTAG